MIAWPEGGSGEVDSRYILEIQSTRLPGGNGVRMVGERG